MQARQVLVASLLAVSAAGAMAQEIDRSETLQAKNLAAQTAPASAPQSTDQVVVVSQARGAEAAVAPRAPWIERHARQAYAKAWLHGDRRQPQESTLARAG